MTGKEKCETLKQVRREIAEQNNINLAIEDCTYHGECSGTCPKCEEELRVLEEALDKREKAGFRTKLAGIAETFGSLIHRQKDDSLQEKPDSPQDESQDMQSEVGPEIYGFQRIPLLAGTPIEPPHPFVHIKYRGKNGLKQERAVMTYFEEMLIGRSSKCNVVVNEDCIFPRMM